MISEEGSRHWRVIACVTLLLAALLIFVRLGHYSLWDDETMVALVAKGVMNTGDTSAVIDHGNIVAYRSGHLLYELHDRSTPPLATYVTAASFSLFGVSAWSARLPFALMGVATFALLLYWARRTKPLFLILFAIGLLCNVSLILDFRQCRYYAPSILFSVAVAYLYWNWKGGRRQLLFLALGSILLFAANYVSFLILYCCMAVDYLLWKRREHPLERADWAVLLAPQIVANGLLAWIWNPFKTGQGSYAALNSFADKVELFFWCLRDLNACEYFALSLLLLGLVAALAGRRVWMFRALLALVLYILAGAFVSPQSVHNTSNADIRYFGPVIPLGVAISAGAIYYLLGRRSGVAVALGCLAFGTTLFHGAPFEARSTLVSYLQELKEPPVEPFGPTAEWINANVPENGTIYVVPDYAIYPLMFHAPKALYAWQLSGGRLGQFQSLAPIHFKDGVPPDFLIGFGPASRMLMNLKMQADRDVDYALAAIIPVFWKDLYRPELFWRTFITIPLINPRTDAVYIFKRKE